MGTSILITQSFIVGAQNTYHDYRDYIFAICSNPSFKNQPIRLNIENGEEYVSEFREALAHHGFTNAEVTTYKPSAWKDYIQKQIESNSTTWVMPFPGDHIYVHPDENAMIDALKKGEELEVDGVAYGHVQDFDYYTDWDRTKVLYNDSKYVLIEWGERCRFFQNPLLKKLAAQTIGKALINPPIMGFITYTRNFFNKILDKTPEKSKRWHDMEKASPAWRYKLLIPKQYMYRHVHGYWIECHFKYEDLKKRSPNTKEEIESWYIKPQYDWKTNTPSTKEYLDMTLKVHPYYNRYSPDNKGSIPNRYYLTPFDKEWRSEKTTKTILKNIYSSYILDPLRWTKRLLIKWKISLLKLINRAK